MENYDADYEIRLATLGAMGGDVTKRYDSVYEIDLEILRLIEEGGGSGSAIQEVDTLPDAEQNKDKIVRLSSDNKLYVVSISGDDYEWTELGSGSSSTTLLQSITYSELKSLRDNSQLVPGQQYRITDYVTTTAQENTQSAGHLFDIIVTANSTNTLNENARAIRSSRDYTPIKYHEDENGDMNYGYTGTIEIDGVKYYKWYTDEIAEGVYTILTTEKVYDNEPDGEDDCGEYYLTVYPFAGELNSDGEENEEEYWGSDVKKSIIKTNWFGTPMSAAIQVYDSENDRYYVYGRYPSGDTTGQYAWAVAVESTSGSGDVENIEDITWWDLQHYSSDDFVYTTSQTPNIGDTVTGTAGTFEITDYQTDILNGGILILGDSFNCEDETYQKTGYFADSKLESWELKYCLDNDIERFSWAQVGQEGFAAIKATTDEEYLWKRYPDADGEYSGDEQIAWILVKNSTGKDFDSTDIDWNDCEVDNYIFTSTVNPSVGDYGFSTDMWDAVEITGVSTNAGATPEGKGVIYYMKDEWNNQVYFDFKNIKIYSEDYGENCFLFGDDVESAAEVDGSINGVSNNNLVNSSYEPYNETERLRIDTDTLLFNKVGYQNIVEVPNNDEYDPMKEYFTVLSLENSSQISVVCADDIYINIFFSTDKENWTQVEFDEYGQGENLPTLDAGQRIYFRGDNPNGVNSQYPDDANHFAIFSSKKYEIEGNFMSLIKFYDDYGNESVFPTTMVGSFDYMFYEDEKLINAYRSTLGATEIPSGASYNNMFYSCYYLQSSPELPAESGPRGCYGYMFYNCEKLNYIKCMLITPSGETSYWFNQYYNMSKIGIFIKNLKSNIEDWSDIPEGWEVINEEDITPEYLLNKYVSLKDIVSSFSKEKYVEGNYYAYSYIYGDERIVVLSANNRFQTYWYTPHDKNRNKEVTVILKNKGNANITPEVESKYILMGDGLIPIPAGEVGIINGVYVEALDKWLLTIVSQAPTIAS